MIWLEYPKNTPTENKTLFIRTIDNHYYTTAYRNGKFLTYCSVTHFCEPDPIITETEEAVIESPKKKRGRPPKKK